MTVTWLLILVGLAGLATGHPEVTRKPLAREYGFKACRNTEAGRRDLTDDQGYVCDRSDMDFTTGCCKKGKKHSCDFCTMEDKCCSKYEYCVSCCLKPMYRARDIYANVWRIKDHGETGKWLDEYEYCVGRCRTHRRSTLHENSYIDNRHYCFSETAIPLVEEPPHPPIPSSVSIIASHAGSSCLATCEALKMSCAVEHFSGLNSCNVMREHFECEAACEHVAGTEQEPRYVTDKAPKPQRPAACFIGQPGLQSEGVEACSWKIPHVQRLCPCRHDGR